MPTDSRRRDEVRQRDDRRRSSDYQRRRSPAGLSGRRLAAPRGASDVANRRRGIRRRAMRGALARIIAVAWYVALICG